MRRWAAHRDAITAMPINVICCLSWLAGVHLHEIRCSRSACRCRPTYRIDFTWSHGLVIGLGMPAPTQAYCMYLYHTGVHNRAWTVAYGKGRISHTNVAFSQSTIASSILVNYTSYRRGQTTCARRKQRRRREKIKLRKKGKAGLNYLAVANAV